MHAIRINGSAQPQPNEMTRNAEPIKSDHPQHHITYSVGEPTSGSHQHVDPAPAPATASFPSPSADPSTPSHLSSDQHHHQQRQHTHTDNQNENTNTNANSNATEQRPGSGHTSTSRRMSRSSPLVGTPISSAPVELAVELASHPPHSHSHPPHDPHAHTIVSSAAVDALLKSGSPLNGSTACVPSPPPSLPVTDSQPSTAPTPPMLPRDTDAEETDNNSKSNRCCCFPLTWLSSPRKRLSFVTVMVILVVVQVAISCVLIWLLGYLSTLSTVATLTDTIRRSIMHDVSFELNEALAKPLNAAYDINQQLQLRFPDLANRTSLTSETGWLAELSYVAMRHPSLSRVGFATRNNLYVLITKGIDSYGNSESTFSSDTGMTISVCQPSTNGSVLTSTLYNYRPRGFRSRRNSPPFDMQGWSS